MKPIAQIWFVCAGNICRSVIAEHAFRSYANKYALSVNHIGSSGLIAIPNDVPIADTLRAAQKAGLDLSSHRARAFSTADIQPDSMILVMEHGQQTKVQELTGFSAEKVQLLGSLAPGLSDEIADPENQDEAGFDRCVNRIITCVEALAKRIADEHQAMKIHNS